MISRKVQIYYPSHLDTNPQALIADIRNCLAHLSHLLVVQDIAVPQGVRGAGFYHQHQLIEVTFKPHGMQELRNLIQAIKDAIGTVRGNRLELDEKSQRFEL